MSTALHTLCSAPPSGRSRPLLIDSDDYARQVIRQGSPVPWLDLAALTSHVGQVQALLRSDAVWVNIGALYRAHLAAEPGLVKEMGVKSRAGFALRTLLGHDATTASVVHTLSTLASATRLPLVLDLPSPARWLAAAHATAGTALEEVSEDHADSASMYIAQWLGTLGAIPVALVHLDATEQEGEAATAAESLSTYTSVSNITDHFEWALALRRGTEVHSALSDVSIGVLGREYWSGPAAIPSDDVLLTQLPAQATPEVVLAQLAALPS
ncbi:hypothetical protein [Gephyromycinifex aptenodytis]|uniref:hypothetical protein n=1 Tax=Gephyromycinifex aptenodytis TaxID=2716227 RepID=UPI0014453BCA|nr:hypothetical protein [Gephyromycinifex aptenodytis]